jgi:hypothetical protein
MQVFVIHSEPDSGSAIALSRRLRYLGYLPWSSRDLQWTTEAESGRRHSRIVLVVVSANALRSETVHSELAEALGNDRIVVPIRLDDTAVEALDARLRGLVVIDARESGREMRALEELLPPADPGAVERLTQNEAVREHHRSVWNEAEFATTLRAAVEDRERSRWRCWPSSSQSASAAIRDTLPTPCGT